MSINSIKMKKNIIILLVALANVISVNAQKKIPGIDNSKNTIYPYPILVDEVKKTGSEIVIPYKRYKLQNGLTVLIHEDHSDPMVYVDVTYHVGSAREQQGRSGFAHFFEHMMFQGSKNVADEQHFKIITEAGGTLNGSTNSDRTNYFETVPSNQFEKMLWLEADRMGFLLDSVTQKKFEVQRATVKNERGQNYDNRPYGLISEKIGEALYPQGHPYSWTTIGYLVDLDRVDVNDLKRFYMRWYGASNAVLTVSGDVNVDDVLLKAQKYFGSVDVGKSVKPQSVPVVTLAANKYISYEDNVKFPALVITFPTAKLNTKDDAALDVLGSILSNSQGSPFYKAFIESKKAVSANAYQFSRELAGQFQFFIRANPTTSLSQIEDDIKNTLTEWEKKGATDDDLVKYKAQFQTSLINNLSTVQGKGATLASNFTLANDANFIKKQIATYMGITKADVMRVYNTYIKNKSAVVLSCVPKGKTDLIAKADNWKMYDRVIESESSEYKNLTYKEPVDNFKRSEMPMAQAAKAVPVPNFYTTKINTIPLIGVNETEIPKVNLLISFKGGHRYEAKEKSGMSDLLTSMLDQSTLKTSAEEIENKLDRLGSSVSYYTDDENINVSIQSTKQNVMATLKIVEESLLEPKMDAEEFEIEKKKQLDGISQNQTTGSGMADMTFKRILYGTNHSLSNPVSGIAETVSALTIDDLKKYYTAKINASIASVAVTGDITKDEIVKNLQFLTKLKNTPVESYTEPQLPTIDKTKIYFVDKKSAAQSEIRIGYIALPYQPIGEYFNATIANYSFGGAFNSRINYLLREIKGWTYGTRSGFSGSKYAGPYTLSGGFKSNTTDSTLVELVKEMKKYNQTGITDEELSFTKNAIAQSDALKYESANQKLGFIKRILDFDLPKDYVAKQNEILANTTKQNVNDLAKKYFQLNNMVIVVVGDKATNFEKIKKLGFDVIELDVNGKTIN
jgi:zinc protease